MERDVRVLYALSRKMVPKTAGMSPRRTKVDGKSDEVTKGNATVDDAA